jgi:hypothetical protein
MRLLLGAAIAALACGAAFAQTVSVSDAGKTFSFDKPAKWPALEDKGDAASPIKVFVSGTMNEECWFVTYPRPESANATPTAVAEAFNHEIAAAAWTTTTEGAPIIRDGATYVSSSIDATRTFPVQLATFKGKYGDVYVAIHGRPGLEIRAFCGGYDNKDHSATLKAAAASVTTPKDAEYATAMAAAKTAAADKAAADAAAAAAAAEKGGKKKK